MKTAAGERALFLRRTAEAREVLASAQAMLPFVAGNFLEAECVLLYSGGDFMTWKFILEKAASEPGVDPSKPRVSMSHRQNEPAVV